MRQILFIIPLHDWTGISWMPNIPLYGYGLMLFTAYLLCTTLGKRLCKREGIDAAVIPDLTIWLFVAGIIGARTVFVWEYWDPTFVSPDRNYAPLWSGVKALAGFLVVIGCVLVGYFALLRRDLKFPFYAICGLALVGAYYLYIWYLRPYLDSSYVKIIQLWDGGLVFYGGVIGGAIGYFAYDYFVFRKRNISKWKMLDVVAPCIILGSALGRVGCLFTGCCYGNVACESCPSLHFPIEAPASNELLRRGLQTPYGFLFVEDTLQVAAVEPGSPAAASGLQRGDVITDVNGKRAISQGSVYAELGALTFSVRRDGAEQTLTPFTPGSLAVHPTQIYETISMTLLLLFLLSYLPYRRWHGELMVFAMFGYGIHRFVNEMLRTDNEVVAFGLTLSQNISLVVIAAAIILAIIVYRRPPITDEPPPPSEDPAANTAGPVSTPVS